MTQPRTFIFAGGGTGGHLFPGVAVALELKRREPNARLLFVGSERELERTILARHGLEHRSLPVESLRELTRHPWRFATRNWTAWRAARQLMREERPSVVVGLGGYASAPLVWQASRARCPVVLLEQNVIPGRATRWLSRSASLVCTSFIEAGDRLPRGAKIEVTGNPVRREIAEFASNLTGDSTAPRELLVLGGSQGADSLNEAVVAALRLVSEARSGWRVVHQTGARQVEAMRRAYAGLSIDAVVEPFFDDMLARYRAASFVVSRAGATTLAELACCGLPMLLLPYPHAADDHQRANALAYESHGAAVSVEHLATAEQTAARLADPLRSLLTDESCRRAMSTAARSCAHPDATSAVVNRMLELAQT
ncbi:MAG: undecaprenyldiphospho-muramoylpentapeptide beta-N-acetylglucosaminyltransferase [Candidatus Saccharimonas sp.]|nr:undecaprenyldiphospho-muramoylpentapeptide beta-N-acetylglucosaminyltransferase [Planctomycetaceae bacterium]